MIKNFTPHEINEVVTGTRFPSQGVARVVSTLVSIGELQVDGVSVPPEGACAPIFEETFGEVVGLPDWESGVYLIVSRMVRDAEKMKKCGRLDLLVPGEFVRDSDGKITGCKGFCV
jgi:hypothetical protein